jgi:uncharacterized membrane protein
MRDVMLIFHFIGLAMGLGTSIAFMILGMASSKMEKAEGQKFMINALSLAKMGQIGLLILLISGGYLMTPYWQSLGDTPLMITKLVLFVTVGALVGIISAKGKRAKSGNAEEELKKIRPLGMFALLVTLTIVVLAVSIYH